MGEDKGRYGIVAGVVDASGRRVVSAGSWTQGDARPLDEDTVFEIGSILRQNDRFFASANRRMFAVSSRTMPRRPPLHLLVLAPTLVLTVAASWYPALFISLRRDPQALLRGEVWRLLSPVLIQADALQEGGWWRMVVVLVMVAVVIVVGERAFGARRCLLLYGLGALVGHGVGAFWDPHGSGCSVAGCGILGGIAGWLLRARPLRVKLGAALWLGLGGLATWISDIHGPPLLAGALAAVWLARSVPLPAPLGEAPGGADLK